MAWRSRKPCSAATHPRIVCVVTVFLSAEWLAIALTTAGCPRGFVEAYERATYTLIDAAIPAGSGSLAWVSVSDAALVELADVASEAQRPLTVTSVGRTPAAT
jgi:hypothetical protein